MIVYVIANKINGKQYVGQTTQSLQRRWAAHCQKTNGCSAISRAIQKYGKDNFIIKIIHNANSIKELNKMEKFFIKKLDTMGVNGYNLTTGGLNFVYSEASKRKMSKAKIGKPGLTKGVKCSEATKRKISKALTGRIISKETKQKIKIAHIGKKHTEESKRKMSTNRLNRRPIICNETQEIFESITEASRRMRVSLGGICDALNGRCGYAKGFTFSRLT